MTTLLQLGVYVINYKELIYQMVVFCHIILEIESGTHVQLKI